RFYRRAVEALEPRQGNPLQLGPQALKVKTNKRNEIIDSVLAKGELTTAREIHQHLKEHHCGLLTYGRPKKPISPENMMKSYRAWKRGRQNSSRAGTTGVFP